MTNTSKPKAANLPELSAIPVPVDYSQPTGLALMLADMIVSGRKVVSYLRQIPTANFISGNYSFPTPPGYTPAPYRLPMLEPVTWNVVADIITAYQPVEVYQIGSTTDLMQATFPIIINPTDYASDAGAIKPLDIGQSVVIRVYKVASAGINWAGSNIVNNGLTDEAIKSLTQITMVVTNVAGVYTVTDWLGVDFITNGMSNLKTSAKGNFAAVVNELFDAIAAKTATGTAGGDLTGSYPNPTIKPGVIPSKLPTPNALTFTGGVTGSFDGSAAKTVNIPTKLPTPQALTFTGGETGSYDGSAAKTVNIPTVVKNLTNNYEGTGYITDLQRYFGPTIGVKVAMMGDVVGIGQRYMDILWVNGYSGNDVPNCHALIFDRHSNRIFNSFQNFSSSSVQNVTEIYHSGNANRSDVAWYASGFFQTSDKRLKDVEKPLDCSLEDISKLLPVYYRWKDVEKMGDDRHIGLIAQEVQKLFPELVSENEDGTLTLNYSELSAVAMRGIKLLKDKTDDLETRLALLEAKLSQ